MYKKLNELSFVIGLFFFILSLILIINELSNTTNTQPATLYSGIVFLAFGVIMMLIKNKDNE